MPSGDLWRITRLPIWPLPTFTRSRMSCPSVLRWHETLYFAVDQKPKRGPAAALKRLRNIAANPAVAIVIDHYEDDWARLGWVLLRGRAKIIKEGPEHREAQVLLRRRYPQLNTMQIEHLPVIAVRIERTTSWGDLSVQAE